MDLGLSHERRIAVSRQGKGRKTKDARVAWYLLFCRRHNIDDPCLEGYGLDVVDAVLGCYIESLIQGNNILSRTVRSTTLKGYITAVALIFKDRKLPFPPTVLSSGGRTREIIAEVKRWEQIPNLRYPISDEMLLYFLSLQSDLVSSNNPDSLDASLIDWIIINRHLGCRASEYSQSTQSKIDKHIVDDKGTSITLAFTRNDFAFQDAQERRIDTSTSITSLPQYLLATFRVQKNRMNGQEVNVAANRDSPSLCAVKAGLRIYHRSVRLGKSADEPLGVYKKACGKSGYFTSKQMANLLQRAAVAAHNLEDPAEISRYTSHSLRVWAATLLNHAGCTGPYIQIRLRWKSETFLSYLRNTHAIADKHSAALANIDKIKFDQAHIPSLDRIACSIKPCTMHPIIISDY